MAAVGFSPSRRGAAGLVTDSMQVGRFARRALMALLWRWLIALLGAE
jgi:hypothetical protein